MALQLWYHICMVAYDIIIVYTKIWYHIGQYEIIPRYDIIFKFDNTKSYVPGTFYVWTSCHLRLYAWCNEYMFSSLRLKSLNPRLSQSSLWSNKLSEASSIWFREILRIPSSVWWLQPAHGRCHTPRHARRPLCFIIYRTWRPGWPRTRRERVLGLLGYRPPWPLRQTSQTSLSPN